MTFLMRTMATKRLTVVELFAMLTHEPPQFFPIPLGSVPHPIRAILADNGIQFGAMPKDRQGYFPNSGSHLRQSMPIAWN